MTATQLIRMIETAIEELGDLKRFIDEGAKESAQLTMLEIEDTIEYIDAGLEKLNG